MDRHTLLFRRPSVEEIVTVRTDDGWKHRVVFNSKIEAVDAGLITLVHQEARGGFRITAMLTRFGGLYVFVSSPASHRHWDGDNIIEARQWVDTQEEQNAS